MNRNDDDTPPNKTSTNKIRRISAYGAHTHTQKNELMCKNELKYDTETDNFR